MRSLLALPVLVLLFLSNERCIQSAAGAYSAAAFLATSSRTRRNTRMRIPPSLVDSTSLSFSAKASCAEGFCYRGWGSFGPHRMHSARPVLSNFESRNSPSCSRSWTPPTLLMSSASSDALVSEKDDSVIYNNNKQKQRRPIIVLAACTLISAALFAIARQSLISLPILSLLRRVQQPWKVARRSLFVALSAKLVWDRIQLRKRQAIDLTSEWSRYSRHPAARGRALFSLLCLQMLPLYCISRILPRRSRWRDRVLTFSGRVLADGLLALGPLYIKIGQILSSREALLPKQWIPSLERLQDQVPAKSGEEALQLAYHAWPGGKEDFHATFYDFQTTPLAAASLGQVHIAKLRSNNDTVAIKLQRPHLRRIYDQDLGLLTNMARMVDRFGGASGQIGGISQSWTNIFEDAEEILYREIDYRAEAENGIRFCRDFGLAKGGQAAPVSPTAVSRDGKPLPSSASWLRAPIVYDDLSTEKVLVMELVQSIKATKTDHLEAANVTAEDREYLADCLARAYLRQFCCHYFFSTDPHAGNLGVEILNTQQSSSSSFSGSRRVRLVFYDFGQAATLTRYQADGILEIIQAIVDMDVDKSIESFQKMQVLSDNVDLDKVRAKVAHNYKTGKIKANRKKLKKRGYKFASPLTTSSTVNGATKVVSGSALNEANSEKAVEATDSEIMSYFVLPAQYAFVGRALAQMDGVGKSLDDEFDFITSAAPWIVEVKGATRYLKEEASKWKDKFLKNLIPSWVNGTVNGAAINDKKKKEDSERQEQQPTILQ